MILWYATRTGRRLHLVLFHGGNRTWHRTSICGRDATHYIGDSDSRAMDRRPTCHDCRRVAGQISTAAA